MFSCHHAPAKTRVPGELVVKSGKQQDEEGKDALWGHIFFSLPSPDAMNLKELLRGPAEETSCFCLNRSRTPREPTGLRAT